MKQFLKKISMAIMRFSRANFKLLGVHCVFVTLRHYQFSISTSKVNEEVAVTVVNSLESLLNLESFILNRYGAEVIGLVIGIR